jgi:YfiH family protein
MQGPTLQEFEYFYQFKNIPSNITAIFTNRKLDTGFLSQPESKIKNNRSFILSKLNLELGDIVCAQQTHSANVYIAEEKDKGRGAFVYEEAIFNMDAFITKEKNIALSVFIADCLPVYIIDKDKDVIAIVHAGWKGTKASIVKKTIFMMQQAFESKPKDLLALLGPSLRKCCYEVGGEFSQYFKRGISQQNGKLYLDIVGINYLQLKESGVSDNNIFDSGFCTSCQNDKFFSFRKEKDACGLPATASVAGRPAIASVAGRPAIASVAGRQMALIVKK